MLQGFFIAKNHRKIEPAIAVFEFTDL